MSGDGSRRGRLNRAWLMSQKHEEWERSPNRVTMLMEFYRGSGPSRDLIERIRDKLYACLRHFLASESFREAVEAPMVEVKEVDRKDDNRFLVKQAITVEIEGDEYRMITSHIEGGGAVQVAQSLEATNALLDTIRSRSLWLGLGLSVLAAGIGEGSRDDGFSVGGDGVFAYTAGQPTRPADVGVGRGDRETRRITDLNDQLFKCQKALEKKHNTGIC